MTLGEVELKQRLQVFRAKAGVRRTYLLDCETACARCREPFRGQLLLAAGTTGTEVSMAEPLDDHCPNCREIVDAGQREAARRIEKGQRRGRR